MAEQSFLHLAFGKLEQDINRGDYDYTSSLSFALEHLETRDEIDHFLMILSKAYENSLKDKLLKDKLDYQEIELLKRATPIRQTAYELMERDIIDITELSPFGDNFLTTEPAYNWHSALLEGFESVI